MLVLSREQMVSEASLLSLFQQSWLCLVDDAQMDCELAEQQSLVYDVDLEMVKPPLHSRLPASTLARCTKSSRFECRHVPIGASRKEISDILNSCLTKYTPTIVLCTMEGRNLEGDAVVFDDAKHFQWRIAQPKTLGYFPVRIYNPAAVLVGGIVVVIGRHDTFWPSTRVTFYNAKEDSWSVVHSSGEYTPGRESRPPVLGLVGDQVFFLDAKMAVVRCFDLVLRDWIPLDVKGVTAEVESCARCFMENVNSFIYWDPSKGAAVSVLALETFRWAEQATKGELPTHVYGFPSSSCHGSTIYLSWSDLNDDTALYLLSRRETGFFWSKPRIFGRRPKRLHGVNLTYSSGRLFQFGSSGTRGPNALDIYSIGKAEWHKVAEDDTYSEYTVRGTNPAATAHSTVALRNKLVVFGGFSVHFKKVRILELRPLQ